MNNNDEMILQGRGSSAGQTVELTYKLWLTRHRLSRNAVFESLVNKESALIPDNVHVEKGK